MQLQAYQNEALTSEYTLPHKLCNASYISRSCNYCSFSRVLDVCLCFALSLASTLHTEGGKWNHFIHTRQRLI
jgi:hypothetical protein